MSHYHDEAIKEELGYRLGNAFHRAYHAALARFAHLRRMVKPSFKKDVWGMCDSLEWDVWFDSIYPLEGFIDESISERERFYAINSACERMVG